jgi:hypothetical protein
VAFLLFNFTGSEISSFPNSFVSFSLCFFFRYSYLSLPQWFGVSHVWKNHPCVENKLKVGDYK